MPRVAIMLVIDHSRAPTFGDPMNETNPPHQPKTIAVEPRHTSFWTASLLVEDGAVRCVTSHPYDGTYTEWECSHEEFLAGSRHQEIGERFSLQAVADALAEIRIRHGMSGDALT